ncbi:MAG: hypothetical protein JRG74_05295 [Deltaproteobacteria bacterium]|nr:hypothetical protein [Deltaproteobacteria bacterium]MBW2165517.1 hypothetical protein [Deltaproteobacteria bacterium]
MDRKKKILAILAVIFVISLVYRIMNPFKQEKVTVLKYTGSHEQKTVQKSIPTKAKKKSLFSSYVMLDLFTTPSKHSDKVIKNIFFKKKSAEKKTLINTKHNMETKVLTVEDPVEKIKKDLSKFRIFGSHESGDKIVLFLERGKQIIVIRKGDRIDGKYLVKKITKQLVTLSADNIDEELHIDLGELLWAGT